MTRLIRTKLSMSDAGKDPHDLVTAGHVETVKEVLEQKPETALDKLSRLSATHRISEIEANLGNDEFVIDEMALSGQMTLFYAWPSTGKTLLILKLLIDAIRDGAINAADVFYINSDDNYKGLLTKSRIAHEHGFYMISPAEAGVSPKDILSMLNDLVEAGQAAGKVVILDTLKKFCDMMSKRSQAELYESLRRLVAKNGTVILLGHANKHMTLDAELVFEGTSDTMNDVDCMYSMYRMAELHADEMIVEFRCEKDRGDVIKRVSYSYSQREGASYYNKLDSVKRLSDTESSRHKREAAKQQIIQQYESEVIFIQDQLKDSPANQSRILEAYDAANGDGLAAETSKTRLKKCLDKLSGIAWQVNRDRSQNNAKIFSLKNDTSYAASKWGES